MCLDSATLPRPLHCHEKHGGAIKGVTIIILYEASCNLMESEKVIADPHPDLDQQQSLITSTASPLAHAYHV